MFYIENVESTIKVLCDKLPCDKLSCDK